jgi:hypothetical protein
MPRPSAAALMLCQSVPIALPPLVRRDGSGRRAHGQSRAAPHSAGHDRPERYHHRRRRAERLQPRARAAGTRARRDADRRAGPDTVARDPASTGAPTRWRWPRCRLASRTRPLVRARRGRPADPRDQGHRRPGGRRPSPFVLQFDHAEIEEGPMGWMVEDRHLRRRAAGRDGRRGRITQITGQVAWWRRPAPPARRSRSTTGGA